MWAALAAYFVALVQHGCGYDSFVDGWMQVATQVVPALVCWFAALSVQGRRSELLFLAIAESAFATGTAILSYEQAHGSVSTPGWFSVGYLAFYPAAGIALVLAIRRRAGSVQLTVLLDCAIAGLAAASAVGVLLAGTFTSTTGGRWAVVVALAYPVFDLLLVVLIVSSSLIAGAARLGPWWWFVVGLGVLTAADVTYDRQLAQGSYVVGTPLDATWALGLTLMAVWALMRPGAPARRGGLDAAVLAVPTVATLVALAVLATRSVPDVAAILATVTVALSIVRTHLAFRGLRRIADLRRQASTDDLTGLPNRRAFYSHVPRQLQRSPHATLLLLDLDKFKEVNDALGHGAGDHLLVEVGHRLQELVDGRAFVARLGGDEFAMLLPDSGREGAERLAAEIRDALQSPFELGEITVSTTTSVGISVAPDHGLELSALLRRADIAMYKAKRAVTGHATYSDADDVAGAERLRTLQELRSAIRTRQLTLHYQPKLSLGDSRVCGAEALVRWQHPDRGLLPPVAFLELAEESGLMPSLTEAVLDLALDQAALWQAAGRNLTVAVNLSASSLVDQDLASIIGKKLQSRSLDGRALQVEITEDTLMGDRDRARRILQELRQQGVQVAIDDFGTGYSSLAYLRELPVDELKLDRSFVSPMVDDPKAAALVVSIVSLAKSMDLRTVAEGVEHAATLRALAGFGCDQAQGYHILRPVPAEELESWLDRS